MLVDVLAPVIVVAVCWFIYRLSPPPDGAHVPIGGTAMRVSGRSESVSWHPRRRYLVARVLRAPVRHLVSVVHHRDVFQASCVCGWQGAWHAHHGDAFAQAHVHTRYVDAVIRDSAHAADPHIESGIRNPVRG
jgi:hypothetical protein